MQKLRSKHGRWKQSEGTVEKRLWWWKEYLRHQWQGHELGLWPFFMKWKESKMEDWREEFLFQREKSEWGSVCACVICGFICVCGDRVATVWVKRHFFVAFKEWFWFSNPKFGHKTSKVSLKIVTLKNEKVEYISFLQNHEFLSLINY